jgi:2-dehydro-3-deoxy-D-arabinonate dehydratase
VTAASVAGRRFVRAADGSGRVCVGVVNGSEVSLLGTDDMLATLTAAALPAAVDTIALLDEETCELAPPWTLLMPLVAPETWGAGVTYERSRDARVHESSVADVYDLVYDAERPELFLKDAGGRRTVGPGQPIRVRADSSWTVPEPEVAIVLDGNGAAVAATIANDVTARDIEGANPLYLPQAKTFAGSCSLGPALVVPADWGVPFELELRILGPHGDPVFEGSTSTASMRRSVSELLGFLLRDNRVAPGTVLMTGTGVIPPDGVALGSGQTVEIRVPGIGTLRNPVAAADRGAG